MTEFVWKTRIQRSGEEVFEWHTRPGAFQRLAPPWAKIMVESAGDGIRDGAEVHLTQKIGPFRGRWHVRHEGWEPGRSFSDRQLSGPFKHWLHQHRFEPAGEGACDLIDRIEYQLPLEGISKRVIGSRVRRELERVFRYRHEVTKMDLETHRLPEKGRSFTIAITGATGLIGSRLAALLRASGHQVRGISRSSSGDIRWDPEAGKLDLSQLEGLDAVVHLAGEPIAQRWTRAARERILESRRKGTRFLAESVARLRRRPGVFVSISGVNAYGAARSEPVSEASGFGDGFLARVCREWEAATAPAEAAGIRTVIVRSGVALSPAGGALAELLPFFRAGLGGPIGRGERWMSWIGIDDLVAVLAHAVLDDRYRGVFNGVSPNPVRNREFAKALGSCLRRPAIAPVPPPALKLAFGRMADETILGDLRVAPDRLQEIGYRFRFPQLPQTLCHLLGRVS